MPKHIWVAMLANVVVAWNPPAASAAEEVSVEQAVAIAIENNPDLAVTANELTIARAELQRANYISQFNPSVESAGDYRLRSGRSNSTDWRFGLSQEIEIFGQRRLRRGAAALGYEQTQAEVRNQVRLLTGAVTMTFYEALRARYRTNLFTELTNLNQRLADAARARFEAGEIGQIDFNLARIRYGESRRALIENKEEYRLQCSSLGRLLGRAAGPEPEPAGELRIEPLRKDVENLLNLARANRPDLKAGLAQISRLRTETELNKRLMLPNPTIGTFFGHEQNTERFGGISLGLSVPIFNRRQAEATALSGRLAQAQQKLRAAELNVEREVRDAYGKYSSALKQLKASQEDVVGPARESFGLLETAFNAGKLDLLSLSVAERHTFEAQMGYVDAWFNYAMAKASLGMAIGGPV